MKLINKINKKYFINSFIIFLVAVVVIYYLTNRLFTREIDERLRNTLEDIRNNLKKDVAVNFPPYIEIKQLDSYSGPYKKVSDTALYVDDEEENEPFRQLVSYENIQGKYYKITVRNSLIENEDFLFMILEVSLLILLLLILSLFYINKKANVKIFKTFYNNLKRIKMFSFKAGGGLDLEKSDIDEFEELNSVVKELSIRAQKEYKSMEELSQNLSHELITPIAVIKSKIEIILQNETIGTDTVNSLGVILRNINKLDKINKSLMLLSKIENVEFDNRQVNIINEIEKILENLEDIAKFKNIKIENIFKTDIILNMNEVLLSILLNNLLSNAIRYNLENGFIRINIEKGSLCIKNSGKSEGLNPNIIFNRFSKGNEFTDSVGLGLAIVKKICDLYGFKIEYNYENSIHSFCVTFSDR